MTGAQLPLGLTHPTDGIPVVPTGVQETSLEAAHRMSASGAAVSLERRVFDALQACPSTDTELCETLGLEGNTERPRRRSLVQRGLVEDSGKRRKTPSGRNSIVWKVVAPWDK